MDAELRNEAISCQAGAWRVSVRVGPSQFGAPLKSAEPELAVLSARGVPKQAETLPMRFGAVEFP